MIARMQIAPATAKAVIAFPQPAFAAYLVDQNWSREYAGANS
jgi:hypothetical protein